MIYAVDILDRTFVKIGYCTILKQRISELQTGCPYEIKALTTTEGTLRQEQALHAALRVVFARLKYPIPANEWYPGRNDFMRKFVAHLAVGFDFAHTYASTWDDAVRQPGIHYKDRPNRDMPKIAWPTKPPANPMLSLAFERAQRAK